MPATKELTVTTGWGQGRKARFVGFAEGDGGLVAQNVGPTTTVITALPRKGDVIVEIDGEKYACWFRNLNPFPARVIVVHEDLCRMDLAQLDDVDALPQIADLGVTFLPKDHKTGLLSAQAARGQARRVCLGSLWPQRPCPGCRNHTKELVNTRVEGVHVWLDDQSAGGSGRGGGRNNHSGLSPLFIHRPRKLTKLAFRRGWTPLNTPFLCSSQTTVSGGRGFPRMVTEGDSLP